MDRLTGALPFWLSLCLVPVAIVAAGLGGWWLLLIPGITWWSVSIIDGIAGQTGANADPETPDAHLFWYRLVTLVWFPIQFALVYGMIAWATRADLGVWQATGLFFGVGVLTGTVGVNYAHELMHQRDRTERWLADLLLAMVLYGHFRSEHLLVHHPHVGTPKDPVTARYNEGFHRFYPRVLREGVICAFSAERAMLARKGCPWWHRTNPFWRYALLQTGFVGLAIAVGGAAGLGLFFVQAGVAIWQLELVNYVEHYGLTRRHLGGSRYEPVKPRHSWNAGHRASNWLLINLQRHSDHHCKPNRRFPLLQTYGSDDAPCLPASYPVMTVVAMIPPLWRRIMNPRVRAWRRQFYPDIETWRPPGSAHGPRQG